MYAPVTCGGGREPALSWPPLGNMLNLNDNRYTARNAIQNKGAEIVAMEKSRATWSNQPPLRVPVASPINVPMVSQMARAAIPSSNVAGTYRDRSSNTF